MRGLARVNEECRRAGRGECRRELLADMPALADTCDDDAAAGRGDGVNGLGESSRQAPPQGRGEGTKDEELRAQIQANL